MLLDVLAAVAVLVNGFAAGIMASTVIGIVPMMLTMAYPDYIRTVRFLWPRYDPIMPSSHGLVLALDVVLAITVPDGPARPVFIAAAVLEATVMTISVTRNVPVNRFVKALDPGSPPENWAEVDPRRRWRRWNVIRTSVAVLAFVVNIAGLGQLA